MLLINLEMASMRLGAVGYLEMAWEAVSRS